jgi:hypothetical protein
LPDLRRNLVQRLVPRNRLEPCFSLGSDAPGRRQQSIRTIDMLAEMAHLAADKTARDRVVAATVNLNQSSSLHGNVQGAQVRAIKRTGCAVSFQSGTSRSTGFSD